MGSLCIAIAAFTTQTYSDAQPYAIAAASLFLIAFAASFLFKIFPNSYFALMSYIPTALAVMFLFLVVSVFMRAIPVVGKSVSAIPDTIYAFSMLFAGYFFHRIRKKTKSSVIHSCCTIGIPIIPIAIGYYVVTMLARFIGFTIPDLVSYVYYSTMLVFSGLLVIMVVTEYRDRKKARQTLAK